MTKTEALKKFFKKFFDIDAHGWGTVSVLNDVIENNESLDGGGGSGSSSGGGGVMVVNMTYDESAEITTLDKTWQEIYDILASGMLCVVCYADSSFQNAGVWPVTYAGYNLVQKKYQVVAIGVNFNYFATTTTDGYPCLEESSSVGPLQ